MSAVEGESEITLAYCCDTVDGLLPVLVLSRSREAVDIARELAAVLVEQRGLVASEAAARKAKRAAAEKQERFGRELVFSDSPGDLEGAFA